MASRYCEIDFGHVRVKFYPLTIGQLQELDDEMKAMMGVAKGDNPFEPTRFKKLEKIYTASAKRGDPSITEDVIRSIVDLSNIVEVNRAVLGQTGLLAAPGAESSSNPTKPLTGADSTPA
jgi:hypothetical protein